MTFRLKLELHQYLQCYDLVNNTQPVYKFMESFQQLYLPNSKSSRRVNIRHSEFGGSPIETILARGTYE